MNHKQHNFSDIIIRLRRLGTIGAIASMAIMLADASNAAVVQRSGAKSTSDTEIKTTNRASIGARMPVATAKRTTTETVVAESEPEPEPEPEIVEPPVEDAPIIETKTSQFEEALNTATPVAANDDAADTELAEMIRRQRAALDAADATSTAAGKTMQSIATGKNSCDGQLRACMQEKCGTNFLKCRTDGDTLWGDKMDACRRNTKCNGTEYRALAAEIKADRDMNARLDAYETALDCGNRYNDCIMTQCGQTFSKCLGKTPGDAAIDACKKIAQECTQADNGLASRTLSVFGTLRQDAEVQVKKDEQRLYDLREKMADQCRFLGAMFDERSLTCVYTVNFFAGNSETPYASKKAYAGNTFDCTQNWFGVDVTTFKENAYRYTRAQTSATSALMGSGVGMAVGAITSGAIDRAIDRKKADDALKDAKKELNEMKNPTDNKANKDPAGNESTHGGGDKNNKDKKPDTVEPATVEPAAVEPADDTNTLGFKPEVKLSSDLTGEKFINKPTITVDSPFLPQPEQPTSSLGLSLDVQQPSFLPNNNGGGTSLTPAPDPVTK